MATTGSNPSSWSGWQSNFSTDDQVGMDATLPVAGSINEIHCYVGHEGSDGPVQLGVWSGDTVLVSAGATAASCSPGTGNQSWTSVTGLSVPVSAGTIRIGWDRSTTNGYYDFSYASGDTYWRATRGGSMGGWSGASSYAGAIGAWIVYTTSTGHAVYVNGVQATIYINGVAVTGVYLNGSPI